MRLRYKSSATCSSVTFPYSAVECAHSIKLYIVTHTRPCAMSCFTSFTSVFLPPPFFRKWKYRQNGMNTKKKKQSLCYVLAIRSRDVTEISLFLSILPPTSSYTATGCIKRNTTTTLRTNTARKAKCSSKHISLLSLYRPIWNRRLLWKLTLCQLVKQIPAYHKTRHRPLP